MSEDLTADERVLLDALSLSTDPLQVLRTIADESEMDFLFNNKFLATAKYVHSRLMLGLNVNRTNANAESLVHFVAKYADHEWFQWLLTIGSTNFLLRTDIQENIYHYSAHITQKPFLDDLFSLTDDSEHLFCVSELNQTPFEIAIKFDNPVFLAYYLQKCRIQMLAYRNDKDQNILHLIAHHNAVNCYELLKSLLSPEELSTLEHQFDADNCTALNIAEQKAQTEGSQHVFQAMMGYTQNNVGSLQWKIALYKVNELLSEGNDQTEILTLPHLSSLVQHAYRAHQTRAAAEDYQNEIYDQNAESPYPRTKVTSP